jgi:bile acid-coenzyme A ligase
MSRCAGGERASGAVETVPSLGERFGALADQRPDAPAVTCDGESRTWRELERRTNWIAGALEKRGVREGSFLTIGLPNGIGFVEAAIAAWKLGAVPQPVSAKLPAAELEGIVALADPPVVIGAEGLVTDRPLIGTESLAHEARDDGPLPPRVSPSWKAPTSGGSTGRPKLIVSGHPGLFDTAGIAFWRIDPGMTLPVTYAPAREER